MSQECDFEGERRGGGAKMEKIVWHLVYRCRNVNLFELAFFIDCKPLKKLSFVKDAAIKSIESM